MINTVTAAEKNPKDFPGETTRFGPLLRPAAAGFTGGACRALARRRAAGPPAEKEAYPFSAALTISGNRTTYGEGKVKPPAQRTNGPGQGAFAAKRRDANEEASMKTG